MEDQKGSFERDHDLLNQVYRKYAKDGIRVSRWRLWLRFYIKKNAWMVVLEGSRALKRLIDIFGSAFGLLALSPVFGITALLIKLEDGGPIFFSQQRVGKWGRRFNMYKFRSMVVNADKIKNELLEKNETGGVIFKMKKDPRITRVGRIIRKLSIDELPQLYNVLKGDMSLVGPRPSLPKEVDEYSLSDRRRLEVIPGLTCLWQVSGRSDINFEGQVRLDVQYLESQSLWGDIVLLLKTIPAVLLGKGAY
ncbi:MAG: sugar transferase [Syntrophaceae bacterium]|nr:sugar transferase [Syntrophaceae bacterium]